MFEKPIFIAILLFLVGCNDQGTNGLEGNNNLTNLGINGSKNNIISEPLGSQLKSSDGTPLLNRVMSVSDPMRNPNWNWTQDKIDTLYITSYDEPKYIRRPYYGSSSIKPFFTGTDGSRDIWPKDGWELVLRDFGTSQYHVSTPYFILYNKHIGLLRYFFFGNLVSDQITHAVATLSVKDPVSSPIFALTNSAGQFLNNYQPSNQHTISAYYQDQWNVMDFRIAGFDPNIHSKYARFIIDVDAYKNFDLNAQGTLDLNGVLGRGGSTHSSFVETLGSGVKLYKNIAKGYKDIKDAQETFRDMIKFAESDENNEAWWSDILAGAATVGATSWIPALGPVVGVAKFVLGGGSSQSRQPKPITLTGGLSLKGTISSTSNISQLEFIVPGAQVNNPDQAASYNELPLYNNKTGVFNLVRAPKATGKAWGECYSTRYFTRPTMRNTFSSSLVINYDKPAGGEPILNRVPPGGQRCETFYGFIQYNVWLDYVKNEHIFNDNEQLKMAFTFGDKKTATDYRDITDGTASVIVQFTDIDQWYANAVGAWATYFDGLGVLATLHVKNGSSAAPVQLLKEYPVVYGQMENLGVTYY